LGSHLRPGQPLLGPGVPAGRSTAPSRGGRLLWWVNACGMGRAGVCAGATAGLMAPRGLRAPGRALTRRAGAPRAQAAGCMRRSASACTAPRSGAPRGWRRARRGARARSRSPTRPPSLRPTSSWLSTRPPRCNLDPPPALCCCESARAPSASAALPGMAERRRHADAASAAPARARHVPGSAAGCWPLQRGVGT